MMYELTWLLLDYESKEIMKIISVTWKQDGFLSNKSLLAIRIRDQKETQQYEYTKPKGINNPINC